MDAYTLYWLTRLEEIKELFDVSVGLGVVGIILVIIAVVLTAIWLYEDKEPSTRQGSEEDLKLLKGLAEKSRKAVPIYFSILILMQVVSTFIPNNRDLAVILGGYYVGNNEEFSAMPSKAAKVVNKFMDEYLKEEEAVK